MAIMHSSYDNQDVIKLTNTDVLCADKLLRMQLTNIRKSKHLTQKQLADITGLSESTISSIESATSDSSPTMRSLIRYATGLGVEFDIRLTQ